MVTDDFPEGERASSTNFLERLGVRLDDQGRLTLELTAGHLRKLGIAHGGVIATLLDSAMGMAAARSAPDGHNLVTAQLNVHFIRPALEGMTLVATAEVRHGGRKTAVVQGEIRTASGSLVATASATFIYLILNDRTRGPSKPPGPADRP